MKAPNKITTACDCKLRVNIFRELSRKLSKITSCCLRTQQKTQPIQLSLRLRLKKSSKGSNNYGSNNPAKAQITRVNIFWLRLKKLSRKYILAES